MRNLTVSALLAALAVSTLAAQRADACGNYTPEPRVMRLSTHFLPAATGAKTRSFVLVGPTAAEGLVWRLLAPRSYDATKIADAAALEQPVALTLLGPTGARVVKSSRQVVLAQSWEFDGAMSALEVPAQRGARFEIAIEGAHADARWISLDAEATRPAAATWLAATGVKLRDPRRVSVRRIHGTDFETVSFYPEGSREMVTYLKQGDRNHGRFEGAPVGAIANRGARQLVLARGAESYVVYLGTDA